MGNILAECINSPPVVSESAGKNYKKNSENSAKNSQVIRTGTVDESDVVRVVSDSIKAVIEMNQGKKRIQETETPWSEPRQFYRVRNSLISKIA